MANIAENRDRSSCQSAGLKEATKVKGRFWEGPLVFP